MLKTTKNITITGQSFINDKQVVFMTATISTDGAAKTNIVSNIMDETLYQANKEECRKDMLEFQTTVYTAQDEITEN